MAESARAEVLLREMGEESFLLLTQCEHLSRSVDNFNFAHVLTSINYDFGRNRRRTAPELNPAEVDVKSLMKPFLSRLGVKLAEVLPGYKYSVVVYFLPGTTEPLPVYLLSESHRKEAGRYKYGAYRKWLGEIEDRIRDLSATIRHEGMPPVVRDETNPERKHLFHLTFLHARLRAEIFHKYGVLPNDSVSEKKDLGFAGSTLWLDLDYKPTHKYELVMSGYSGSCKTNISWRRGKLDRTEAVLVSPVFVNEDTLVSMASYLTGAEFRSCEEDSKKRFLDMHGSCARQVFGPVYAAMLRGDMAMLRTSLKRTSISGVLLDEVGKNLGEPAKDRGSFTSKWRRNKGSKNLQADDFKASIYGDIIKDPDNIYVHVLGLEQKVYTRLRHEWRQEESSRFHPSRTKLPSEMPLADLLRGIEEAGRALLTTERDHIVHQFQVFLLGSLVIRLFACLCG